MIVIPASLRSDFIHITGTAIHIALESTIHITGIGTHCCVAEPQIARLTPHAGHSNFNLAIANLLGLGFGACIPGSTN
jgi:hypothetical protein